METIREAKSFIDREAVKPAGAICPCCDRLVKNYRRSLRPRMAATLIALRKLDKKMPQEFHHTDTFAPLSVEVADFAKLRFWGLIEEKPYDPDEFTRSRTSGCWRVTPAGIAFVEGKRKVMSHVLIRDNAFLGFSGVEKSVDEIMRSSHFDYRALMANL